MAIEGGEMPQEIFAVSEDTNHITNHFGKWEDDENCYEFPEKATKYIKENPPKFKMADWKVRINGGEVQDLRTRCTIYRDAAAAAYCMLADPQLEFPIHIEIWVESLVEQFGSNCYHIHEDEYVNLVVGFEAPWDKSKINRKNR